jgi:hypothetical protein
MEEIKEVEKESGPLEKRIISSNWSTRKEAYEELTILLSNYNESEFNKYKGKTI